jgi:hypothetical protein
LNSRDWDALIEFVELKIGKPVFGIDHFKPENDLYHDLDLNPPAIEALIEEWSAKFDVDILDFDLAYYYPFSAFDKRQLLWITIKTPFSRTARETLGGYRITLGMLEEFIRCGRWVRE